MCGKTPILSVCLSFTFTLLPHSQHWHQMHEGFSLTKQFSNSQWTLSECPTNVTQLWHCPPEDNVRYHRLRVQSHKTVAPHFRHQSRVQVVTCASFCLTGYKSEIPMTLSSSSTNLPEQLTRLRKSVYLLNYPLHIKGSNWGTVRWKRCPGVWKGARHSPSTSMCLPKGVRQILSFGLLWRLPSIDSIDQISGHGQLTQPPAPLPS